MDRTNHYRVEMREDESKELLWDVYTQFHYPSITEINRAFHIEFPGNDFVNTEIFPGNFGQSVALRLKKA